MKRIIDHLQTLPEPFASQAIKNTQPDVLYFVYSTQEAALIEAFKWELSPEGLMYWKDFQSWFFSAPLPKFVP